MLHNKDQLAKILRELDLGSSVAELDDLLETARVETSVFTDLARDRIDLIPGTKGSGKSALYRIFVDFLSPFFLKQRKVVIAHGVQSHGDSVFLAFQDQFETLSESDFVNFWCVYLVSLAHEHFLKNEEYSEYLVECTKEIEAFRRSCQLAKIPEIKASKTLRDVLAWGLNAIPRPRPKVSYSPTDDKFELDIFGESTKGERDNKDINEDQRLPKYIHQVKDDLERILGKARLHLWLMIDRLDEIFPRRTALETRALRGLLKTLQIFQTEQIRIKIFLRDDILDQVTSMGEGFTALTHVTARQSDKLSWSEDQILTLIVNRFFASDQLCQLLKVNREQLKASREHQRDAFYRVFPPTVYSGKNQSSTLRWIYNHTMDGRGVVTPRDVIDLLTKAKQRQQDEFQADPTGTSDWVLGPAAIRYGLKELSERKRETLLQAEFPHFWPHIEKFVKGKTEYSERAIKQMLGQGSQKIIDDLVSVGLLSEIQRKGTRTFKIPFVYWEGLQLTRGKAE